MSMGQKSDSDLFTAQLQNILHIANGLKEAIAVSNPPTLSPSKTRHSSLVIDPVNLPNPGLLLPSLLEAGASHEIAAAANKIYELRALELRQHIQQSIVTAWHGMAELPVVASALSPDLLVGKVISAATHVYLRRLEQWKEDILQRVKQVSKPSDKRNARTFNHEFVPVLEQFFEENPFPTHADKMYLAKKSRMEYRQIHVWFQNRRNRTKKEGKTLRKKPICEGPTIPMDRLYTRMEGYVVNSDTQAAKPSSSSSSEATSETEAVQDNVSKDAFLSSSPPHAFPSLYPPNCLDDPFPCKTGAIHLNQPQWQRVPDGRKPLPLSIGIDDLVERFSHLNVRGETRSRGPPKLQSHAATVAITVIPSRAPHPALMVRIYNPPTQTTHQYPSVRAPVSRLKAFRSPHPSSKPLTLVPHSIPPNKSELPVKRKTVPLPQRFPGRRNTSRNTTPSESSSTSPSSPPLFSMDSDSRSCCSSSVSSSSTPPDIGSVQELPSLFGSPCCSAVDSPIYLGGCGAVDAIPPLSIL